MLKYRKIISAAIIISMVVTTSIVAPVAVNAADDSYRDGFINALINSQDQWIPQSSNSVRMAPGFSFMDLDFDGRNELYVQEAGGTMDNHSARIYYYENNQLKEATGKEYGEYLNGLTYYYNNNTGTYLILGVNSCAAGFASDRWIGNYTFTFNNHKPEVKYYSARYMKVDRQTYQQSFTYYDGANGYGDSSSANVISETQYNNLNNQVVSNCVNVNMKSEKILKNDWNGYSTSEKRAKLLSSYNAFSYDKKSLTTTYGKDIYVCDNYQYYIENNEAHIIGYTGTLTNLVFPDEILGYKVTVLGNIEGSYTEPMKGFGNVKSITIGKYVRRINENAFANCSELTSVNIGSGVREISWGAFSNCQKLSYISLPDSAVFLGARVFDNTAWYNAQPNGVLYIGKIAYGYKGTMPNNYSLSIKNGTCGIAAYAFSGQSNLTSLSVPNSVHCIGRGAFDATSWYNNTKSSMTNGAVYVGKVLYKYVGTIPQSLTLKAGTTGIAERALYDGAGAYWNSNSSSNLRSISLPDSLVSIGICAFENCINLSELTIPRTVQYIGEYAYGFHACQKAAVMKADGYEISIRGEKGTIAEQYAKYYDIKFISPFFELRKDTNQYIHQSMSYYISNKNYRNKLYWDSLNTWDSTFRIHDQIYSGKTEGVCHGIALSMCYAKNGDLDLNALNNGRAASNYWELGSIYDSDKTRFRDLVAYYQLTQLTANGKASYSVAKDGWHIKNYNQRLKEFLQKFKQDAERAQNEQKPFVFSFSYKHGNNIEGHSVVVCGYHYNNSTQRHEITIYDENTYSNVRYLFFTFPSDYSSFRFTDANGEYSNYWISDIWTCLKVYDIEKLYSKKDYTSISVVKGSEPVSANNTSELSFTANKRIKIVNESGEYIEFDGTNYKGNMKVYDCSLEDNLDGTFYWKLTVDRSARFFFSKMDNECEITGETNSGGFYVSSNHSDSVDVNGKTISVTGQNYDFDVAFQTQSEKDYIRMQGKAGGNTVLTDNNNTILANSNQYVNDVEVISFEEDSVKKDSVDGTVKSFNVSDYSGDVTNSERLSYTFGDVNNDGKINSKDRILLSRYLAKWQGYSVGTNASDLNRDGVVDAKDRVILARRLARWDGFTTLPYIAI